MKKLQLCILGSLFAASYKPEVQITPKLSIWFDTPNNLDGRATSSSATDKYENNSLHYARSSLHLCEN